MVSLMDDPFPASMVDVILNGVATSVEVEVDGSKVKAGYVWVKASTTGFLRPRSIRVVCSRNGNQLQIVVTDLKKLQAVPAKSVSIKVKNTGPAIADGGIANTGVLRTDELVVANTGVRIHDRKQDPVREFFEVRSSGVLRRVTKPQLSLKLTVGPHGLQFRIAD